MKKKNYKSLLSSVSTSSNAFKEATFTEEEKFSYLSRAGIESDEIRIVEVIQSSGCFQIWFKFCRSMTDPVEDSIAMKS